MARRDLNRAGVHPMTCRPSPRVLWLLCPAGAGSRGGPSSPQGASGGARRPVRQRVLVVEDDWLIAAQIESYLAAAGIEVAGVAIEPDEALRLAHEALPQIVLMDIRLLGDADGVELAKQLWKELGLRCLFVSANIETATKLRAAEAHPLGWLAKPFTEAELIDAVSNSFDQLGAP
jgi:two-component system, response regulator PdtaR